MSHVKWSTLNTGIVHHLLRRIDADRRARERAVPVPGAAPSNRVTVSRRGCPMTFVEFGAVSSVEAAGSLIEDGVMSDVKFVRRMDGLTYEFARDGETHGFPSYKRVDMDLWCRRLPDFGWVVCSASGEVSSRPFDDSGRGDLPPEGVWVSREGDRSYVYDLIRGDGDGTPTCAASRRRATPPHSASE
ncbi:hypothetical protein IU498_26250 [Nocardia beijingensis]|nr:hypothetical protein [Nocardia beijingensis]